MPRNPSFAGPGPGRFSEGWVSTSLTPHLVSAAARETNLWRTQEKRPQSPSRGVIPFLWSADGSDIIKTCPARKVVRGVPSVADRMMVYTLVRDTMW